jgi:hypothetical protein
VQDIETKALGLVYDSVATLGICPKPTDPSLRRHRRRSHDERPAGALRVLRRSALNMLPRQPDSTATHDRPSALEGMAADGPARQAPTPQQRATQPAASQGRAGLPAASPLFLPCEPSLQGPAHVPGPALGYAAGRTGARRQLRPIFSSAALGVLRELDMGRVQQVRVPACERGFRMQGPTGCSAAKAISGMRRLLQYGLELPAISELSGTCVT